MHRFAIFLVFIVGLSLLACNFVQSETPVPTPVTPTQTATPELPFDPSELMDQGKKLCESSSLSNWMTDATLVGANLSSLDYEWDFETGTGWATVDIYPIPVFDGYSVNFSYRTVFSQGEEVNGSEAERILNLASEKLGGVTHLQAKYEMRTEGDFLITTYSCHVIKD